MKRLIAITTPCLFEEEATLINRLFGEGLQTLHLRKPEAEKSQLSTLLEQIEPEYYPRIILHDHFDLAPVFALGGVHLNRRNSKVPAGFAGSVSRSCHTLEELKHYEGLDYLFLSPIFPEGLDYLFLSPIFPSISKEGYGEGFPLEVLKNATEQGLITRRIIALGGMDTHTILRLKGLGFGGVAVLGALWGKNPQPEEVLRRYYPLKQATEQI